MPCCELQSSVNVCLYFFNSGFTFRYYLHSHWHPIEEEFSGAEIVSVLIVFMWITQCSLHAGGERSQHIPHEANHHMKVLLTFLNNQCKRSNFASVGIVFPADVNTVFIDVKVKAESLPSGDAHCSFFFKPFTALTVRHRCLFEICVTHVSL